jgi:hypothetical protein
MNNMLMQPNSMSNIVISPFNYHQKLRDHFKSRKKTWQWFAEESVKSKQIEEFKSYLLKNTYRMDRASHKNLYALANEVCTTLSIDADITIYQEQNSVQLNAGVSIINKEAHIVLSGNLINLLSDIEVKAVLAHELAHYLFYKIDNEEYEITQRIVLALANDPRSEDSIIETARIFQLYMELFCDLGALKVCKDYKVVIQALVKLNTGLTDINAESYLEQAKEIIKSDSESTLNQSHPECYIRCLALYFHDQSHSEFLDKIRPLIEGELDLNKLDIFKQTRMQEHTNDLLQLIIRPNWMNSTAVLNLCKQFFDDFYKNSEYKSATDLAKDLEKTHSSIYDYFSYILLDFSKVDPSLEGAPLGHVLDIAELLGIEDTFEKVIRKELKLTIRDFKQLKKEVLSELSEVTENKEESIYSD